MQDQGTIASVERTTTPLLGPSKQSSFNLSASYYQWKLWERERERGMARFLKTEFSQA